MNPAEHYIIKQPEPYKEILLYLQLKIEQAIPNLELKYKYRLPFYYLKGKPFCYFNASHKKQYVDIGFCKGQLVQVHQEHLVTEKRKKMCSLRYKSFTDINDTVLEDVLKFTQKLY